MAYLKLSTGEYPRHEGDVRIEHPDMGKDFVLPAGWVEVKETPHPTGFVRKEQCIREIAPVLDKGEWKMAWQVKATPPEEKKLYDRLTIYDAKPDEKLDATPGTEPDVIG